MINTQRLAQRFTKLCEIDSISRHEQKIALELEKILKEMGAKIFFDNAKEKTGGDCSNMIAKFNGNTDVEPLLLSGHMDTVGPGNGVKVKCENGIFSSSGDTILGADDKSAIAIILEVMDVVKENNLPCPPVEIVFTVCEEIGLIGAKHLDLTLLDSKFGYILDSTDYQGIVTKAPSANKINIKVYGQAAHGATPEKGINAILVASKAIANIQIGRIDKITTCNLGTIKGGEATNIVPEFVEIKGEARSHDNARLEAVTQSIADSFEETVKAMRGNSDYPKVDIDVIPDFPRTDIPKDHPMILLAQKAASNIEFDLNCKTVGGGADANILFGKGIMAGVLGTGMKDVHTVNEHIDIKDMEKSTKLVLEILRVHAKGEK
ncbi:MAG: M20/M25/M40 family metallo-hydrolase [Desulfobacteraceae bacterium]|nr:M20/M25/M40 family metallo-hydrolase [Desulfobacteraceae bacterium]